MKTRTQNAIPVLTTIGVDIGKDIFHIVGFDATARSRSAGRSSDWRLPKHSRNCIRASSAWKRASARISSAERWGRSGNLRQAVRQQPKEQL